MSKAYVVVLRDPIEGLLEGVEVFDSREKAAEYIRVNRLEFHAEIFERETNNPQPVTNS